MYDSKKDKTKDQSLGLHSAAMNGNVGNYHFYLLKEGKGFLLSISH